MCFIYPPWGTPHRSRLISHDSLVTPHQSPALNAPISCPETCLYLRGEIYDARNFLNPEVLKDAQRALYEGTVPVEIRDALRARV